MNILVCASEFFPHGSGIANVAHSVTEQWKKQGARCTVCSPSGPDIPIESLRNCGYAGIMPFWEKVRSRFDRQGGDYDLVWLHNPMFVRASPFRDSLATIHTTSYGHVERKGHPLLLHSYYVSKMQIERYCWNKLDRAPGTMFSTISCSVAGELTHLGIEKHPIIPNGVDTERFSPRHRSDALRARLNIPPDAPIFLSVGRLTPQKMPLSLLHVFNEVQKELEEARLLIVGTGELLDQAIEFVRHNDMENVIFLGRVPDGELPSIYASSDYYVMASIYEGQPLTVLEAMASGLPCIVSDIPSIDVVRKAEGGLMVDFQDARGCADAIVGYLRHQDGEHGGNGRSYVEANLDWDIIARRYLELAKDDHGNVGAAGDQ
ncbi:MAG: glycosyltransferase family 4 protein [Methanomassiliicoccus sp.]|nr:glycosyltransferase family 4 protein [Methanomassiliicoccus sp.]